MSSFPTTTKSWSTIALGDTIEATWFNEPYDEITAIETVLLAPAGSWTPSIGGSGGQSGQAYTTQEGSYLVRWGGFAHIQLRVILSALGTITGNVQIQGLPYTCGSLYGAAVVGYWSGLTSSLVSVVGVVNPGTTTISLFGLAAAAATQANLVQGDLAATSQFIITADYLSV